MAHYGVLLFYLNFWTSLHVLASDLDNQVLFQSKIKEGRQKKGNLVTLLHYVFGYKLDFAYLRLKNRFQKIIIFIAGILIVSHL